MPRPLLLVALSSLVVFGLAAVWHGRAPSPVPPSRRDAPRGPSPLAQRARELLREGRADAALALLVADEAATLGQLQAGALLVELSRQLEPTDLAVERAERLVAAWPERSEAHHALSQALGSHIRDGGLAAAIFSVGEFKRALARAVELDPGNVDARVSEIGFHIYAPALVGASKDEARRLGAELRRLDPAAGAMMLALTLDQEGRLSEALALCREASAEHPGHQDLGVVHASLAEQAGAWAEAMEVARRVVDGPPTAARFRALFQLARMGLGHQVPPETCLEQLDEVAARAPPADFMPTAADVQYQRGRALERLRRLQEARAAFALALASDPGHRGARAGLQRLE